MDRKILRIRISVAMSVSALVLSAAAWGPVLDGRTGGRSDELRVLIGPGSGGETRHVRTAVRSWAASSGHRARVDVAADMPRQLSRGFATGNPPDVFALDAEEFAAYATRGFLHPYGGDLDATEHLHPALAQALTDALTVDGDLACAPRITSTRPEVVAHAVDASGTRASSVTECWGIAADSADHDAAVDLVRHLTRSASDAAAR